MTIPHPPGCPACGSLSPLKPLESHFDPIGGKRYGLFTCRACSVVSTEPREPVGAEWYAKEGPTRAQVRRPPPEADWRFREFFSEGLPPGRLLDVGCGDGGFMLLAAAQGYVTTGFDYDERVVAQARRKGLRDVHAMEFSAFCASRRSEEFDIVTLFDVLEHTPEPAWFLGEIRRLLKPGGYLAVNLPNYLRPTPLGREAQDFPPHHFTRWTPDAMKGFLAKNGFEVVRQDAETLHLGYLADSYLFFWVMPRLLAGARRILFGRQAPSGATLTELYERSGKAGSSLLGDKLFRQRLVSPARAAFSMLFAPVALCLRIYFRVREPRCGECLYTLARRSLK